MVRRLKRSVGALAIFAIALHTLLWAFAVPAAAATGTLDPFSSICHSNGGAAAADQDQSAPASKPSAACDHCNLCAATPTSATPDVVLAGRLLPECVLAVLSPVSVERRDGVTSNPKLARGPPQPM